MTDLPQPYPKLDRNNTFVVIRGISAVPSTYTINSGETIELVGKLINVGDRGLCRIMFYDELNREIVASKEELIDPNQTLVLRESIKVERDLKLVAHAQWYDAIRDVWRTPDSYGYWILNVVPTVEGIPTGHIIAGALVAVGVVCGLYYLIRR